jgi:3-deoxy-D-manno-octulosonic-acid transferase
VGEVSAAAPLILLLREQIPDTSILVTTNTPTGRAVLLKFVGNAVVHAYLPLDFAGPIELFVRRLKPKCLLPVETEIWPNLYEACAVRGIPVVIINGRISPRTLKAGWWLRPAYRRSLRLTSAVLARSDTDRARFIALGTQPEKTRVMGNLKYAAPSEATHKAGNLVGRPYVLAASTHDDEEVRLARLWETMNTGSLMLVIVPRHPNRGGDIVRKLQPLALNIAVRSHNDPFTPDTDLYLADTLGELQSFMAYAELVFMGGSLVPHGGQNLLEPARYGKAIISGPHMDNFADETADFMTHEAMIQVEDDPALQLSLQRLIESPDERARLGANAKRLVVRDADIAARYLGALMEVCNIEPG